jgi:hypothetical protein
MNNQELVSASRLIARSNVNEKITAVTVDWDEGIAKLIVTYYIDGLVTNDEQELCELTLTELLAEFSDVKLADSQCLVAQSKFGELSEVKGLVYLR